MTATENGVTYKANWWVQGVDPAQHNGVGDSGEAWTIIAGGTNDPTPRSATKVYTAGLEVSENGVTYQANWWVQGATVPTGLAASGTSSSVTDLSWNASTVSDHSPVTGYAIFENDHQLATTTATKLRDHRSRAGHDLSVLGCRNRCCFERRRKRHHLRLVHSDNDTTHLRVFRLCLQRRRHNSKKHCRG